MEYHPKQDCKLKAHLLLFADSKANIMRSKALGHLMERMMYDGGIIITMTIKTQTEFLSQVPVEKGYMPPRTVRRAFSSQSRFIQSSLLFSISLFVSYRNG